MVSDRPNRRTFLLAAGVGIASLAGCQTQQNEAKVPSTETSPEKTTQPQTSTPSTESETATTEMEADPDDGLPPATENPPDPVDADPSAFDTIEKEGPNGETVSVPLVPIDVAINWYRRREARFVDARSKTEHQASHITGAVSSPAPSGQDGDDPVDAWPRSDRVVTYCGCPHYLSSVRAAHLQSSGYEEVYALDEGFTVWQEQNYPVSGDDVASPSETWTVTGEVPEEYAGEDAIITKDDQMEGTEIAADGSYTLHVKFVGVTDETQVTLQTSAYELTESLGTFASGHVTADGTVVTSKN
ncbi:rhodanese-like domain-containing protein [Halobacteriaceae archaeon GCM10025711]